MLNFGEARKARVSARAATLAGRWATPAERRRGSGASVAMRGLVTERRGGARATRLRGVALEPDRRAVPGGWVGTYL